MFQLHSVSCSRSCAWHPVLLVWWLSCSPIVHAHTQSFNLCNLLSCVPLMFQRTHLSAIDGWNYVEKHTQAIHPLRVKPSHKKLGMNTPSGPFVLKQYCEDDSINSTYWRVGAAYLHTNNQNLIKLNIQCSKRSVNGKLHHCRVDNASNQLDCAETRNR